MQEAALARNKRDGYKFGDCKMSVSLYDAFGSLAAIPGTGTYSEINASFCGVRSAMSLYFLNSIFLSCLFSILSIQPSFFFLIKDESLLIIIEKYIA